jgi:sulfur carrier protein ThiS
MEERAELLLVFEAVPVAEFLPLLMTGVGVAVAEPCTPREFLHARLGLSGDEIERRVSTVCVDGHPVDDLDGCFLDDGSRLALSGALPGLAGACLRRGGVLATMRQSITLPQGDPSGLERGGQGASRGTVTVRLFNTVLPLLGERLLARGVSVESGDLVTFLDARPERFWRSAHRAELGGRPLRLPLDAGLADLLPEGPVRVTVKLNATLRDGRFETQARDLPDGSSLADLIADLGIAPDQAALRFVNGRHAELTDELHDGDTVALFPPIGGG